ncbi:MULTISPECIES: hypothetical protein [Marinitoga]|jgi:hypothetical protein|uniref:hypothetical protein n=1 Tax=Marinitoga TaxID=160798 RepID=UPI0013ECB59B|nr:MULTISPECIES: hypothetical protein [Marinitoga]KAF2955440.1 hypothetical protein AS160_10210 [Marinitoga sp. 38H-ov]MBM7559035.1 hypothetical protein [Marinitoga litoralis]
MKKIIVSFLILILSIGIFANIYQVIPKDSKLIIVMNNTKEVYSQLKTVPTFQKVLDDPTYAETLITGMIDAYIQSLELESSEVYAGLENNFGIFVIEPQENTYDFGIILGPLNNGEKYIEIFRKVINALMPEDAGLNFSYIVKKSELQDYLVITTNKEAYENSELNFVPQKRYNDTGIYEEINTSTMNGYGYSYVKDGYLYSKFNLLTDDEIVPTNNTFDDDKTFGLYYLRTNYLPKDLTDELSNLGLDVPKELLNSFVNNFEWATFTGTLDLKTDDQTGEIITDFGIKITFKSNILFKDIENSIPEDIKMEKMGNEYLKLTRNVNDEMVTMYIWKNNEEYIISNLNKKDLQKYENNAVNLSKNKLYIDLKDKLPEGNLGVFLIDLKPVIAFLKDYLGVELEGEFGGLANVASTKTPDGKNTIEFNFVMK